MSNHLRRFSEMTGFHFESPKTFLSDISMYGLKDKYILFVEENTRYHISAAKRRDMILREQIVKILLQQTLTDSSLETRTDGWGILQNLVLEEERDFCVHLYRQDILTAIEGASKSVSGKRSRLHEHSSLLEVDRSNPRVPRCTLHKTLEATATSCLDLHQFNCQPDFLSFGSTG